MFKKIGNWLKNTWNNISDSISSWWNKTDDVTGLPTNGIRNAWESVTGQIANEIARQNLAYTQAYNQEVFDRADNANQRAAEDLQAAGLSKTLAAGNPAAVGGNAVSPNLADTSTVGIQNLGTLVGLVSGIKDIAFKQAQIDNIATQTRLAGLQADNYVEDLSRKWESLSVDNDYKRLQSVEQSIVNKYKGSILQNEVDSGLVNILKDYNSAQEIKANYDLIMKKIDNEVLQGAKLTADIKRANLDYASAELDKKIKEYDFGLYSHYGLSSSGPSNNLSKMAFDITQVGHQAVQEAKSGIKNFWSNISDSLNLDRLKFWK